MGIGTNLAVAEAAAPKSNVVALVRLDVRISWTMLTQSESEIRSAGAGVELTG